ncbi:Siderophore iron transporter mirB 5 [Colletotrichum chlorophyti]|uniref:Siderophore iron transporter mirB 5 n=1 Tax=Colletotrichum chlorophyti TaxID=708187 RepID=A0A1Q8S1P4_9PEZI|nr:Siderophore iron transporter mirB 5 [Colletotrichum chlorophyti]
MSLPKDTDNIVNNRNAIDGLNQESICKDAQAGVQKIEATTLVWSKTLLIVAYAMMWCIYFVNTMQQNTTSVLAPYVTSKFAEHSLTATTNAVSSLFGGLIRLPLAKVLDIWGRPQGYAFCVAVLTLGLILMAGCENVETYAVAQVIYWVGYSGLAYTMSIFIADTSALKNRGLMLAFSSSPHIITGLIGGPLANSLILGPGYQWGFIIFAIVTPVITMPLFGIFMYAYYKAKKKGLYSETKSTRTTLGSINHYFVEFDIIGIVLILGGFALLLLPFSLSQKHPEGLQSPTIIAMILLGAVLLVAFVLWEKFLTPVRLLPYNLLVDRTILGGCILPAVAFVSFYTWNSYFSSFLQVVHSADVIYANHINEIYSGGSCVSGLAVGLFLRSNGGMKWIALCVGVPLNILGVGLIILFRQPGCVLGYIIMCQIFIAVAGGTLHICEQMAVMAVVEHQHISVVLAMQGAFSSIAGAVGATIATAIWQSVFPTRLMEYLPEKDKKDFTKIYGDLAVQLSYRNGTATRDAIICAYGDAQKNLLITATAILALSIPAVAVWRDVKLKEIKQTKGTVV